VISKEDIKAMKTALEEPGMDELSGKLREAVDFYEKVLLQVISGVPAGVKVTKVEPKQVGPWTGWMGRGDEPPSLSGPVILMVVLEEEDRFIEVEVKSAVTKGQLVMKDDIA